MAWGEASGAKPISIAAAEHLERVEAERDAALADVALLRAIVEDVAETLGSHGAGLDGCRCCELMARIPDALALTGGELG